MKLGKRLLSMGLMLSILSTNILPLTTFAQTPDKGYSIQNDYLGYSVNPETGGFHIETFQGHPQKQYDDNMPLLYKDEVDGSIYTSFTTIRVGEGDNARDFIFGKDYGFWGLATTLGSPVVADGGRSLSIDWTLNYGDVNITVTQRAAISTDEQDQNQGNIALQYAVKNNSSTATEVSVRVLLDTALGNRVDAPYLTPLSINETGAVETGNTVLTETEYTGEDVPDQIRGLDSLNHPTKASYLIFNDAVGTNLQPDRLILGHWANLANTRYDYSPDTYSDFTNYSNQYRIPDAAAALYWENQSVEAGQSIVTNEVLYGVGDFELGMTDKTLGLTANFDRNVTLNSGGDGYENSGKFTMMVDLDNAVDGARKLTDVKIYALIETKYDKDDQQYVYPIQLTSATVDESKLSEDSTQASTLIYSYPTLDIGDSKPVTIEFQANVQKMITTKSVSIGVTAVAHNWDGTEENVTFSLERAVLLPGTGIATPVTITEVAPKTVYTQGTKNINLAGNMKAFEALDGSDGWNVLLRHEGGSEVMVNKSDLAFMGDYTTAIISTDEELLVGKYRVVFEFTDPRLQAEFGAEILTPNTDTHTITVSNDDKYATRTYGIIALARTGDQAYDFFTFDTETAYQQFEDKAGDVGNCGSVGLFEHGTNFDEILLVVRGAVKEVRDANNNLTGFTANPSDGDITINDMMAYIGPAPLTIGKEVTQFGGADRKDYVVRGDGMIKVVGSIDIWGHQWSLCANDSQDYSLRGDGVPIVLELEGAGQALQAIAGFAVQMKYGELSAEDIEVPILNDRGNDTGKTTAEVAYGIGFGGSLSLPIGSKTATAKTNDDTTSPPTDPSDPSATTESPAVEDSVRQTDTSDVEDMSDSLNDLFRSPGERTIDQEDISDGLEQLFRDDTDVDSEDLSDFINDLFDETGVLTSDQEEINDMLGNLFDETGSLTIDQEDLSDLLGDLFADASLSTEGGTPTESGAVSTAGTATTTHEESEVALDAIQIAIDDILYGQNPDDIQDIGFIGIDTTVGIGLPDGMLGHVFTKVAPSVAATVTINTIDGYYGVEGGVSVANKFAVEFALVIKEFESSGRTYAAPDKVAFYIRDGLWIPIVPPTTALLVTGLGGGVDNLVDSCAGNFKGLPPVNIMLGMNFEVMHVVQGQIDGTFGLSGMDLVGVIAFDKDAKSSKYENTKELDEAAQSASGPPVTPRDPSVPGDPGSTGDVTDVSSLTSTAASGDSSVIQITAKVGARWLDPWQVSVSGDISAFMGVIKGGIYLTFSDEFQGGYAYCTLCLPDELPLVGGMELAGVEMAANQAFIGGNVKILGISYGVIYYWDGNFSFGEGVDVSAGQQRSMQLFRALSTDPFMEPDYITTEDGKEVVSFYGTNIKPLSSSAVDNVPILAPMTNALHSSWESQTTNLASAGTYNQMLLEIPFAGGAKPDVSNVTLTGPNGQITLTPDDGNGGGNYLAQLKPDGTGGSLYITVLNASDVTSGNWSIAVKDEYNIWTLGDIEFNGVAALPTLEHVFCDSVNDFSVHTTANISTVTTGTGEISFYLTQDKDILTKMKTENISGNLGNAIYQTEWDGQSTSVPAQFTLPQGFESGEYYVVSTLSLYEGGMSTAISDSTFDFVNPNLPSAVKGAKVIYAGDGEVFVDIHQADVVDYQQYHVEIFTADGGYTGIENYFQVGEAPYLGKAQTVSTFTGLDEDGNPLGSSQVDIPGLEVGTQYIARVTTMKETDSGANLYGNSVDSAAFAIPELDPPKLISVTSNISRAGLGNSDVLLVSENNLEITYTFDRPVWMIWSDNGETTSQGVFKDTWRITHPLVDGQHNIDFTVYGKNKDMATSDDFADVMNAQLGFQVDTTPPILTFTQSLIQDAKVIEGNHQVTRDVATSTNVVYADENGDYDVYALCEASAVITVNGQATTVKNLTRTANGSICYTGNIDGNTVQELTFLATDGAGNQTELVIYAVDPAKGGIASITLAVLNSNGTTTPITDKKLTIREQDSVHLVAVSDDAILESTSLNWELLYEKNIVAFYEGQLTGLIQGETALKVSVPGGLLVDGSGNETLAMIEDYVIVQVEENPDLDPDIDPEIDPELNPNPTPGGSGSAGGTVPHCDIPFEDVFSTDWFYGDVCFVFQKGYMVGVSDTLFAPKDDTTRGMLMTVLAREAGVSTENSTPWYQAGLEWAVRQGVSDGTFPTEAMTREQMVTMLWRYVGSPTVDGNLLNYTDGGSVSSWAQQAMVWAVNMGIIKGTSSTTLSPQKSTSRAEFAVIFHRFYGL